MNSGENIEHKMKADATHQEMNFNANVTQDASVLNPVLKDQKRVIRKMVVMNTNRLKGLGIETTIKNAMSKLEKDKNDKNLNFTPLSKPINQSTSQIHVVKPKLVSSRSTIPLQNNTLVTSPKTTISTTKPSLVSTPVTKASALVLTSPTMNPAAGRPKSESTKIMIPVTKQVVRQTLVSSNSATSAIGHVNDTTLVYSKSTIPVVKHLVQPTLSSSKSSAPAVKHADKITLASNNTIPLTGHVPVPPSTSFVRKQPHNVITNSVRNASANSETLNSSKIETRNPEHIAIINATSKPNEIVHTVASDAKKIKVLSDVSLNDTKAKLLEIDKFSSTNLKLTNVIKGTDKLVNSKITSPVPLTTSPLKMVLPTKPSSDRIIKITIPAESKKTASRIGNLDPYPLELAKEKTDAIWASNNRRTYARDDVKKLLNAKIMNKTRLQEEAISDKVINQSHKETPATILFHADESRSEVKVKLPKETPATVPLHAVESRSEAKVKVSQETPATVPFYAVESRGESKVKLTKETPVTIPFHAIQSRSGVRVKVPRETPATALFNAVESGSEAKVKLPKETPATVQFHAVQSRSEVKVNDSRETSATAPFYVESGSEAKVKLTKETPVTIPFHRVESRSEAKVKAPKETPVTVPFHTVESRNEAKVKPPKETPVTNPCHVVESRRGAKVEPPKETPVTIPFHTVESKSEAKVKLPKETPDPVPINAVEKISEAKVRSEAKVKPPKETPATIPYHVVESRSKAKVKLPKETPVTVPFLETEGRSEAKLNLLANKKDAVTKDSASVNHLQPKPIYQDLLPNPVKREPIQTKLAISAMFETPNVYSEELSPMENEFYGFTTEEVNESADNWNRIKTFLLKNSDCQTLLTHSVTKTNSTDVNYDKDSKVTTVESANDQWILNCETGILEEVPKTVDFNKAEACNTSSIVESTSSKIAENKADSEMLEEVPKTVDCNKAVVCNKFFTEKSTSPKKNTEIKSDPVSLQSKEILSIQHPKPKQQLPQVLEVNVSKALVSLPASPVKTGSKEPVPSSSSISAFSVKSIIEDADDEISDIDTVHRRKTNSRATFKTFEIHRKAWNTSTDDESELTLSVRPPRPKLRKSRHKQTMEQMKIQQNAHVDLLKRFNQPDSQNNVWNDEMIMSFVDGLPNRVDALNIKVKKCFDRADVCGSNLENVSNVEHLVTVDSVAEPKINLDPVPTGIEPVKVNESSVEVIDVPRSSVIVCESQLPQKSLSKSERMENTDGTIDGDGPSKTHKITIQKETFLVTEVDDNIEEALPTPNLTHVKLEKAESPQPCSSFSANHINKDPESARRKMNSKQPLEEMLAQYPKHSLIKMLARYLDEDTLKSVIFKHNEQYILSDSDESSLDSDSDTDSDSETSNDKVNKIFKTILTIDLCDDDDETVHEDVRHLLNENSDIDDSEKGKDSSKSDVPRKTKTDNKRENLQSSKMIDDQPVTRIKSELPDIPCTLPETIVLPDSSPFTQKSTTEPLSVTKNLSDEYEKSYATPNHINVSPEKKADETKNLSEENEKAYATFNHINASPEKKVDETAAIVSTNSIISQDECTRTSLCNEVASFLPTEIVNPISMDTESNSSQDFVDSENLTEFPNIDEDDQVNNPSDLTKHNDAHRSNETNDLGQNLPEVRPIGHISNGWMPKVSKNELLKTNISIKTKSFDDALTQADSILIKRKQKRKSVLKDEELNDGGVNQQKRYKNLKHLDISSKSKSLVKYPSGLNETSKSMDQSNKEFQGKISVKPSAEMLEKGDQNEKLSIKFSAEMHSFHSSNAQLPSIDQTQIECETEPSSDSKNIDSVSTVLEPTTSNIPKPSQSRKRNLDKSIEVASTAESIQMEERPTPKRPKFEYFESPEILTTKRPRKTKCYADCETSDDFHNSKSRSVRQPSLQPVQRSNVFQYTVDTELTDAESQRKISNDITETSSSSLNSVAVSDDVKKLKNRSASQPKRKPNRRSNVSHETIDTKVQILPKFETDSKSHTPLPSEITESSESSYLSETPSTDVKKRKNRTAVQSKRKSKPRLNVGNENVDTAVSAPSISEPDALPDTPLSNDKPSSAVNEKEEKSAESSKSGIGTKRSKLESVKAASLSSNEAQRDTETIVPSNSESDVDVSLSCDIAEKPSSTVVEKLENSTEETLALIPSKTGRGIKPPELAPVKAAALYTCGNCKEEVRGREWTKHMKSHYGLAWRTGLDPPYDLENSNSMAQRIIYYTKKENIRFLKCNKCGVEKKSALGYLSHVEICGLTDEEFRNKLVKCEYCPKVIRSCSVRSHESSCAGLKKLWAKEKEDSTKKPDSLPQDDCYNDQGRIVRQSAKKALTSFKEIGKAPEAKVEDYIQRAVKVNHKQQRKWMQLLKKNDSIDCVRIGCTFTTKDMTTMLLHFNTCLLINGETFYCTRCEYGPDNRDTIEEHIKASHTLGVIEAINDVDFSDSDDDAEVGEESESESEGESGDDESLEKEFEQNCDEFDDDDDDGWNSRGYKNRRIRDTGHNEAMINNCLDRKVLNEHATLLRSYSSGPYFQPSLEWTQDFRDKHFSTVELLPFAMPNKYSVLNSSLTDAYSPKVFESNKFFTKQVRKYNKQFGSTEIKKTDQWMTLKKFEAMKQDDSIIFFAGGPIVSMAWLPVPDDHTLSQILAICCRNDPNEHISLNDAKETKCLIQIWNFNNLKNNQLRHAQTPQLLYSIAYNYGPVIQMEFCPSGGFTEDRLGLLAVSTCDGHVDLLALPKNITCDNSTVSDLIFVIEPSLVLCCDLNEPLGVLITKLVWSQSKGHTKLAAGYSNGMVAIWNFKNVESPNICNRINGTLKLLPTDMFFAAHKCIRLLEFHHDEKNEARWLIVGSHDRKVRFYDTHNVYLEISTAVAHSRIVAGCWPMHWTSFLIGIDNAYSFKIAGIVVKQPLDIGCRTATFYSCIGSTCDISFNNWLNSYVFVSSYGDIYVQYIRQMISGFSDVRKQRFIIGYTDMINAIKIDLNENNAAVTEDSMKEVNEPQPSTSSAVNSKQSEGIFYPTSDAIVFCDFDTPLPAITSPTYEKIRAPPMDTFNMVKVNKILFNPNVSAYKLYALGYESGFVRIKQLKQKQL